MKVNNFEQIGRWLRSTPASDEFFYDVEIVRRGKDFPDLPAANRNIKNYCISGYADLMKYKDEIISIAEATGSRVYICLSRKSYKRCMLNCVKCMADRLYINDYKKAYRIWWHAVGITPPENKLWVLDIDTKDSEFCRSVIVYVNNHNSLAEILVPTIEGNHLICPPFNTVEFAEEFPNVEIKKHGLTLLYA